MGAQGPVSWFRRQSAPVTIVICALILVGSLVTWFAPMFAGNYLAFPGTPIPQVWTLLTYPFVSFPSPLYLLFQIMWMYWVGGTLEYDHGSKRFAYLWLVVCALAALPMTFFKFPLMGMLIPDAILLVIWATRYPNIIVRIFGIIPVAAKWLAVVGVAAVFFMYAQGPNHIHIGLVAVSGCILGWLYSKNMIPKVPYGLGKGTYVKPGPTKAQVAKEREYYDEVYRREKEREEKERLRKLFEGSLDDKK